MTNITMNCSPGSYSASGGIKEVRDFYERDGKIVTLTQLEMMKRLTADPMCIVPVQITQKDRVDQGIIDEIAKRKLLNQGVK